MYLLILYKRKMRSFGSHIELIVAIIFPRIHPFALWLTIYFIIIMISIVSSGISDNNKIQQVLWLGDELDYSSL